jgi:hypothetical protein
MQCASKCTGAPLQLTLFAVEASLFRPCLQTPALYPFPDLTQPEVAFPQFPQSELDPQLIVRLEDVYLKNIDMPELVERARQVSA